MAIRGNKPSWWFDADGVEKAVRKAASGSLGQAAAALEREVKTSMSTGGGARRTPSAPGKVPHVQTGNLRASIQSAKVNDRMWIVGPTTNAIYGQFLEFGTRHIQPRPFMFPALLRIRRSFPQFFKNLNLKKFYRARKRIRTVPGAT